MQFTCDDKQTLIAYLYGEIDPAARHAVDAHLAQCRACAAEVTALGGVRSELGLWVPPHAELDFTIVKKSELPPSNVLRPARGGTPCRCGRKPPPRSWCSPPAPRSPTCK